MATVRELILAASTLAQGATHRLHLQNLNAGGSGLIIQGVKSASISRVLSASISRVLSASLKTPILTADKVVSFTANISSKKEATITCQT